MCLTHLDMHSVFWWRVWTENELKRRKVRSSNIRFWLGLLWRIVFKLGFINYLYSALNRSSIGGRTVGPWWKATSTGSSSRTSCAWKWRRAPSFVSTLWSSKTPIAWYGSLAYPNVTYHTRTTLQTMMQHWGACKNLLHSSIQIGPSSTCNTYSNETMKAIFCKGRG